MNIVFFSLLLLIRWIGRHPQWTTAFSRFITIETTSSESITLRFVNDIFISLLSVCLYFDCSFFFGFTKKAEQKIRRMSIDFYRIIFVLFFSVNEFSLPRYAIERWSFIAAEMNNKSIWIWSLFLSLSFLLTLANIHVSFSNRFSTISCERTQKKKKKNFGKSCEWTGHFGSKFLFDIFFVVFFHIFLTLLGFVSSLIEWLNQKRKWNQIWSM